MISNYQKTLLALAGLMAANAKAQLAWDADGTGATGTAAAAANVGGTGNWDGTGTRFYNGTSYVANSTAADSVFIRGADGTITVSGTQDFLSLQFNQASTTFTITGGTLRSNQGDFNNAITLAAVNGVTATINSNIDLSVRRWVVATGNSTGQTLNLGGTLSIAGQGGQVIANSSNGTNKIVVTGAFTGTAGIEFGHRTSTTPGRIELRGASTFSGVASIVGGTTAIYTDVANSTNGALGNSANGINIGFGQAGSATTAVLVTNGARTVSKAINVANGGSNNTTFGVTIGGETADISTYSGNIDLDGANARTTKVSLTAADGGRVNFTGVFSHGTSGSSVPIEKIGLGTVNLTGDNTYTGATTVAEGTLLVNNTAGSGTGTGDVNVGAAGTLGGNGTISGSVSFTAGASFVFSSTDALSVNGASVSFGGFGVSNLFGLTNAVADGTYTLIDGSASISSTNLANLGSGSAFDLGGGKSAYFDLGTGDLQVIVSSIPEPSTFAALAGLGVLGLATLRRRRAV